MIEYIIKNDITGLIVDSFLTEELAFIVLQEYQESGLQCHLEQRWR